MQLVINMQKKSEPTAKFIFPRSSVAHEIDTSRAAAGNAISSATQHIFSNWKNKNPGEEESCSDFKVEDAQHRFTKSDKLSTDSSNVICKQLEQTSTASAACASAVRPMHQQPHTSFLQVQPSTQMMPVRHQHETKLTWFTPPQQLNVNHRPIIPSNTSQHQLFSVQNPIQKNNVVVVKMLVPPPPPDVRTKLRLSWEKQQTANISPAETVDGEPSSNHSQSNKPQGKQQSTNVYHDYAYVPDQIGFVRKKTGGVTQPFPEKLMEMLVQEAADHNHIVCWLAHGRAFMVRKPKEFMKELMPRYFRQSKMTSFQRQLNLYGFRRITQGTDTGAYYHELFLRGRPQLCMRMHRQKIKGTGHKQPTDSSTEPNFYAMSPQLQPTPRSVQVLQFPFHQQPQPFPQHRQLQWAGNGQINTHHISQNDSSKQVSPSTPVNAPKLQDPHSISKVLKENAQGPYQHFDASKCVVQNSPAAISSTINMSQSQYFPQQHAVPPYTAASRPGYRQQQWYPIVMQQHHQHASNLIQILPAQHQQPCLIPNGKNTSSTIPSDAK